MKCALCGMTADDVCLPDSTEYHKLDCIAESLADEGVGGLAAKPSGAVGARG
jgi:hypothetical protein